MIEPKTGLEIGVWLDADTHRLWAYRGALPVVVESERPMLGKSLDALRGCISCQLQRLAGKNVLRWLILPP